MSLTDLYYYGGLVPPAPGVDFTMAAAVRGPIAYGARVTQPGTIIPPLRAVLYHRDDLNDPVIEFDQSFARQWQDQINESGSASMRLLNDDPDLPSIGHSDVIRFTLNGWAAFTWLVRDIETVAISGGEEHDEITTISGPGHISVFDEALVYPARGVGVRPIEEDRPFNWTSVDYDDTGWRAATEGERVVDANTDWPQLPFADGWPFSDGTRMIWDQADASSRPQGFCYVRKTYYSNGGAAIFAIIDDFGEIYFDGQLVLGLWGGFSDVYTAYVDCTAGYHTIAAYGLNGPGDLDDPHPNPAGIGISIYPSDPNGQPTSAFPDVHTDSSWKIVPYPPSPPGMTPGEVIIHCVNEARARGCLPPISFAFDTEVDSAGNPWPEVTDITTKTGTDCLTFFREISATYADVWLEPATWTLWAWAKNTRGDDSGVVLHAPTDTSDPWSGNLGALTYKRVT